MFHILQQILDDVGEDVPPFRDPLTRDERMASMLEAMAMHYHKPEYGDTAAGLAIAARELRKSLNQD